MCNNVVYYFGLSYDSLCCERDKFERSLSQAETGILVKHYSRMFTWN